LTSNVAVPDPAAVTGMMTDPLPPASSRTVLRNASAGTTTGPSMSRSTV
jgi:hypothetical protein